MPGLDLIWVVIAGIMVLKMQAGFMCLETGFTRTKNGASVALKNISDFVVVALAFWAVGFGLMFGTSHLGLFGTNGYLFSPPPEDTAAGISAYAFFFFQMAFATTAATIISGTVAERTRFAAYVWTSICIGAVIYPVAGHWAWAGVAQAGRSGWLEDLGFLDLAGSTVVHSVGGWAALVLAIAVGPRLGRFSGRRRTFEPASLPMAALGVMLLWIGWTGFNAGSLIAFSSAVPMVITNTILAAAAGGATSLAISIGRSGYADPGKILNGVIAGLVAITAGCNLVLPASAIAIGAGGAVAMLAGSALLIRLRIDDAVDAVPVHLCAGIWGTLAVALFGQLAGFDGRTRIEQLGIQALGVAATAAWVVCATSLALMLLRRFVTLRVSPKEELLGLNLAEHRTHSALQVLLDEMQRHRVTGSFQPRVHVDHATEVGILAYSYNRVLDRVETEITTRVQLMESERAAREMAEDAYQVLCRTQEEHARAARRDALTGLGNRLLLEEIITEGRGSRGACAGERVLCICIDMDRFKEVNDTYGHAAGDAVLCATAERIRAQIAPACDIGFRIGGDEFVILRDFAEGFDPDRFSASLLEELSRPVEFEAARLNIGASIGYAIAEAGDPALRELIRRADMALYRAKEDGRNKAVLYAPEIGAQYDIQMRLLQDFRKALETGQIFVEFQPQVAADGYTLSGCETLARWTHPERGRIAPDVFIPLAEELDLLDALDRWVLDQAIAALADWDAAGLHVPRLSVNVSAKRLFGGGLLTELKARKNLPSGRLAFEVIESAFIDRIDDQLRWTIDGLNALGIEIEIDDFGTGHASFASLFALRPNRLKLDRIFAARIDEDEERRMLTHSLISMAHRLDTRVIVEGVETAAQADILRSLGAEDLQGYFFGWPMSAEEFLSAFRENAA